MGEKNRYSDEELAEFKKLINEKLVKAQEDYEMYRTSITHGDGNDISDTSPTFKVLEEGAATLVRIENKTYGICRETGRLISKERLRAVPHATLCIDAKKSQK